MTKMMPSLRSSARLLGIAVAFACSIGASAQDDTETKIRLMTEALQARDSGNLTLSKAKLEELMEIAPDDVSVKRILGSVDRLIANADSPSSSSIPTTEDDRMAALQREAEYLAGLETERIEKSMQSSREMREVARRQANRGEYDSALRTINRAISGLEPNPMTQVLIEELKRDEREFLRQRSQYSATTANGSPSSISVYEASPDFVKLQQQIEVLRLRGRSQFFAGDIEGAEATFKQIEALDPNNSMAKDFLIRIARERQQMGHLNKLKTREQLLQEVSNAWQRPSIYEERPGVEVEDTVTLPLTEKLNRIIIPSVNFTEVELGKVVNTLSAISEQFDTTGLGVKGVNLVLIDPERSNPAVNITLRNLSLKRILDFIVDSVGFQYEVEADAVVVRPGGERTNLDTEFFPISRSTVIRMTGGNSGAGAGGVFDDPFYTDEGDRVRDRGVASDAQTIRNFLQQAGVDFRGVEGSTLAYDGSAMFVTQTRRNLERIRNLLNRYTDVKQVEIEAKFLEVQEGSLEELGFDWIIDERGSVGTDGYETGEIYQTSLRQLAQAAAPATASSAIIVNDEVIDNISAPELPGSKLLGADAVPFTNVIGNIDGVNVNVAIRALSQKSGSDLLSAPKVTVLSGNEAKINVSQEFRYPTRYSDTESDVGSTRGDSGSAGVTITPGTPEEFETRNVGVELAVTPIVEEDDYSITLDLNPRVTEFEGFVEYGGPSIAMTQDRVVKTPSGFYQPVFAVREVETRVTIWDGATVVMGGMTREDVVTVSDKVPFLGDIPLFGRLFRSEGESSAKRNLLIFVTANMVSPGGSPKRQTLRGVQPGSLFQNPTIVTPSGSESRSQ
ncbi:type II secretory pathway, component PulD [Pelagicoccus albus]|uniref:Type II secretory pathway, component PulD n=1 Tax=Pelagicoccus albus TaxID=415222 RepID=A0A7X1E708_9BACT|nr:type II secretory pathway, component PulD [Pelagicoccus albus]MBC2605255.1 type II secretory pathway, component PulD [Pelagicoccus albus]